MTNNPDKVKQLISHGIDVVERLPLIVGSARRIGLSRNKAKRMGHVIDNEDLEE